MILGIYQQFAECDIEQGSPLLFSITKANKHYKFHNYLILINISIIIFLSTQLSSFRCLNLILSYNKYLIQTILSKMSGLNGSNISLIQHTFQFHHQSSSSPNHQILQNELLNPIFQPVAEDLGKLKLRKMLDQREGKKMVRESVKKWKNNKTLFPSRSISSPAGTQCRFVDLMAELLQYMINRLAGQPNWRQNCEKSINNLMKKVEKIYQVLKLSNCNIYGDDHIKSDRETINCLKMISNEFYTQKIQGTDSFLEQIMEIQTQKLPSIILPKIAFSYQEQDSQLSVFSQQSFSRSAKRHRKNREHVRLSDILSDKYVSRMKQQIELISCERIKTNCLNSLATNFPFLTAPNKKQKNKEMEINQEIKNQCTTREPMQLRQKVNKVEDNKVENKQTLSIA